MPGAYYNEFDPIAAQWLRNLISAGHIAPGDVDERSIVDVRPGDLAGYTQCHFFAGIGVWSYALRRAGWRDDEPVWTGSCPCQPFSDAGAGKGFDDERHLWPRWERLIRERRPVAVFGEQVGSKAGLAWLDVVHADLEAAGYAVGAVDLCAAGVGAPHIRQRIFFVADTDQRGSRRVAGAVSGAEGEARREMRRVADGVEPYGAPSDLADAGGEGCAALKRERPDGSHEHRADAERCSGVGHASSRGCGEFGDASLARRGGHADGAEQPGRLADADGGHARAEGIQRSGEHGQQPQDGGVGGRHLGNADNEGREAQRRQSGEHEQALGTRSSAPSPVNGFWRDAVWIHCRDGKARPIEPGTFPLAHGAPARVGRLRAYGNAINAEAAREFIRAYLDVIS